MQRIILILSLLITTHISAGQNQGWIWLHGDSTANKAPSRVTFGTPHPDNNPGSRYHATSWTDKKGNFWLYGGHAWYGGGDRYGDLWKYDRKLNQWAWIWGNTKFNNINIYGQKGKPNVNNSPGCRLWAAGCADYDGNLWLYGGYSEDSSNSFPQNDLWRYNIDSNVWTWEGGTNSHINFAPAFATAKNVPDTGFLPRPLWFGNIFTFRNDDKIYLFGGLSQNDSANNALFSFNKLTKEWTWISGSLNGNERGAYGIKNSFDVNNTPPAKTFLFGGVYDTRFIAFGGGILRNRTSVVYNDVWKYDRDLKQWMWVKGDQYPYGYGKEPPLCEQDTSSSSNARALSVCFNPDNIDSCGNLYVYGGNISDHDNVENDLWVYNIKTNIWQLLKKDDPSINEAVFSKKGTANNKNNPGQIMGYCQWMSPEGELYIFGGICFNPASICYNSMWKWTNDSSCITNCYYKKPVVKNDTTQLPKFGNYYNTVVKGRNDCMPNAFTPDNDGKNDIFKILCKEINLLKSFSVYNRWGEKIFQTSNIDNGWDGTYNNLPQNSGVYFYIISYYNKYGATQILKGDVTLIR